jgi:hypothetical protein
MVLGQTVFAPLITGKNKQQTTSEEQMKFNKWTYGLAAVGAVSLTSAAHAEEKMSAVQTALSNTTISGYVSVSANVALSPNTTGVSSSPAAYIPFQGSTKQDGFNLDVVKLSIAKPQDESPWASGYQVDLLFGPDAVGYNTSANANSGYSDFAIKQAYVALRTPVGNGIDWKIGVFDTVIGYEVTDAGSNPNYTRSWGYAVEPTEHTGVLATYKFSDALTVSAGVANTLNASINTRNYSNGNASYWKKTVMGSASLTAPSSWGWASGSMLYVGAVYGFNDSAFGYKPGSQNNFNASGNQFNGYIGGTLNTPWKALTLGAAFDYVQNLGGGYNNGLYAYNGHTDVWTAALYATWKATDKLSLSARGEYVKAKNVTGYSYDGYGYANNNYFDGWSLTGTMQYDLWANVISRLEVRYDKANDNVVNHTESIGLYANIIYKF